MKKKSIIIGTGISIASIIGGYYLTRYGARKYIQNQEHKIVSDTFEKVNSFPKKNNDRLVIEGILRIYDFKMKHKKLDFKMKHKKLYKFAYGNKSMCEPVAQRIQSAKHMI